MSESEALQQRVLELERELAELRVALDQSRRLKTKIGMVAGVIAWRVFAGWRLDFALASIFKRVQHRENPSVEEYANLAGAVIRRMLYVGVIAVALAILPATVAIMQTIVLVRQNEILVADTRERTQYGLLDSLASAKGITQRVKDRLQNFTAFHEVRKDPGHLVCLEQFEEARAWSFTVEQNKGLLVFYRDVYDDLLKAIRILRHLREHTCNAVDTRLDEHIFSEVHRAWETLESAEKRIDAHLQNAQRGLAPREQP
jgi:hypothetical protein